MRNIENIHSAIRKEGFGYTDIVKAPRSDTETGLKFRKICETNRCGTYNTSWTCPPAVGPVDECIDAMHGYDDCIIVTKTFEDVDMNDSASLKRMADIHQSGCRRIKHAFMDEGFDVLALTDGACNFCGSCTYPDAPCRSPEEKVPSVSGYGIDMGEYIPKSGLEFSFEKDRITFYGLMLFR